MLSMEQELCKDECEGLRDGELHTGTLHTATAILTVRSLVWYLPAPSFLGGVW
jgi:hypothetical protein